MGTLLPWNFFITPFDFWMHKLKIAYNETEVNGTDVEGQVGNNEKTVINLFSATNLSGFLAGYHGPGDNVYQFRDVLCDDSGDGNINFR